MTFQNSQTPKKLEDDSDKGPSTAKSPLNDDAQYKSFDVSRTEECGTYVVSRMHSAWENGRLSIWKYFEV